MRGEDADGDDLIEALSNEEPDETRSKPVAAVREASQTAADQNKQEEVLGELLGSNTEESAPANLQENAELPDVDESVDRGVIDDLLGGDSPEKGSSGQ